MATNSALTAVENKIPNVRNLGKKKKKTDYNTKISKIEKKVTDHDHDKYLTTLEFNKLVAETFAARLAQANLVTKTYFDTIVKSLNRKINLSKTKHVFVENEFKKLQTFYFEVKSF